MTTNLQQIVAEIRTGANKLREHGTVTSFLNAETLDDWANRIESATTRAEGEDGDRARHSADCAGYQQRVCDCGAATPQAQEGMVLEWQASDAAIEAWLERHDLDRALRGVDARAAFEDARSAHMLAAAPTATEGSSHE